jgi:RNA polymerase sigma-70 factor, ECF subfamily
VARTQPEDERQLVEAAQKDPVRFAELYERNFHRVYAYVARRVHDRSAAEDVTSEVFHHALKHLRSFEWRGTPFVAWLYRIAANALADRFSRTARDPVALEDYQEPAVIEDVDRRAVLAEAVDTLPPDQRRVIVARYVEQRSIREIAQEMGRSEGAVKQLQLRALEKLREQMGDANA